MQKENDYRNLILGCCMTGIVMLLAFFFLYQTYIQNIIYEERLNQMEEVTHQMFQNLSSVHLLLADNYILPLPGSSGNRSHPPDFETSDG